MFLYTISCMQGGHTTLTLIFIVFYMTAALLQVRTGGDTGGGRGAGLSRRDGRGGPGWAPQTLSTSVPGTGQVLRRTGCSSSTISNIRCDLDLVVLSLSPVIHL